MGELLPVLFDFRISRRGSVRALTDLFPEENLHRALRTHHRNLGGWPGDVEIAANVLRAHDIISTTVRLARNDGQFRNGRLAISKEKLGSMLDDAAVFLCDAREKSRNILERHERNVERIAEPDEPCSFERCIDIEHACQHGGLVCNYSDAEAAEVGKTANDVLRILTLHFVELAIVDDAVDHLVHVVRLVRVVGNDVEQRLIPPIARIRSGAARRLGKIVRRNEVKEIPDSLDRKSTRLNSSHMSISY